MARTPAENIATIKAYWSLATLGRGEVVDLANAQRAMRELLIDARGIQEARQLFAAESIFEMALAQDQKGDKLVGLMRKLKANPLSASLMLPEYADTRSLRQMMLDGIRDSSLGSFWYPLKDATGVTRWLRSVDVSGALISATMRADPDPAVRAAAMTLVRDVAIPQAWGMSFMNNQLFAGIVEALVAAPYDTKTRTGLQNLAVSAQAAVQQTLGAQALKQEAQVQTQQAQTGSGKVEPVLPPPPKAQLAWYKNGQVVGAGLLAFVGGALYTRVRRTLTTR